MMLNMQLFCMVELYVGELIAVASDRNSSRGRSILATSLHLCRIVDTGSSALLTYAYFTVSSQTPIATPCLASVLAL